METTRDEWSEPNMLLGHGCPHSARTCNDCLVEAYCDAHGAEKDRAFERIRERAAEDFADGRMLIGRAF